MASRILIIGGGCTGASAALKLRQQLGKQARIQVWEKARGAGGRYTTSRDSYPDGLKADMGAQYASVDPADKASTELMASLVEAGAAVEMGASFLTSTQERAAGTVQYRGTNGQNGIVKAMLEQADVEVHYEKRVMKLDRKGSTWTAVPRDAAPQEFDCVLLCVPGCGPGGDNLNKIHGNWERLLSPAQWRTVEAPHDCRYSVAMWLQQGHQAALEAFFGEAVEKSASGSSTEHIFWQSRKDGEPADGPQVIVAHTPRGATGNKHQAEPRIIGDVCRLLKLPSKAVTSTKIITWFQSQVLSSNASPSQPCLVACEQPALILAGDYFSSSTFSGCVRSAGAAVDQAARLLGGASVAPAAAPKRASKWGSANKSGGAESPSGGYPEAPKSAATPKSAVAPKANTEERTGSKGSGKSKTGTCGACGKKQQIALDSSDGAWYCAPCWKAYYGRDHPWAGA